MHQMLRTLALAVAIFSLLTWTFTAGADPSDPPPASSASALSVGGEPVLYGETDGDAATFQRDFDGGYAQGDVTIGYIAVAGSADGDEATSRVDATDLSLIDGRVTLDSLAMAVSAGPGGTGVTEAAATGLMVDGSPVSAGPGTRIFLAGFGTLVFFEQVTPAAGAVRANALRLEPDGSGGVPAGPASIGSLAASAPVSIPEPPDEPIVAPPPTPEPKESEAAPADTAPVPDPQPPPTPRPPTPEPTDLPAPVPTVTPPAGAEDEFDPSPGAAAPVAPQIGLPVRPAPRGAGTPSLGGYVFPVFGDNVAFGNDYGAPRAVTGWHHGNDLFAPTGTPVLAVADGELFLVGVNRLGGNRLWLRDDEGNEFYYAHLSAYTPLAVDGARVRAGDPIGFIGNSGQAITTPPHLHFEIHPGGLDSVNPYPYLLAWQRRTDVPRAFREATVAVGQAPAAGALVIEVTPDRDEAPKSESGLATPVS